MVQGSYFGTLNHSRCNPINGEPGLAQRRIVRRTIIGRSWGKRGQTSILPASAMTRMTQSGLHLRRVATLIFVRHNRVVIFLIEISLLHLDLKPPDKT